MKAKFLLLNLMALFVSFSLIAQQGSLDNSFSSDGKVTTDFGSFGDDSGNAIAIQSDGKIVVAGIAGGKFALVRYNINGILDNTFGSAGKVSTAIGTNFNDWGYGISIQSDGKIVVAGSSDNGTDLDFAVARYNINGSLDNTFSSNGKLTTAIGTDDDVAKSVAIQPDGKIVVAGYSYNSSFKYKFTVVRYNNDGTLDNTFDTDGILTTNVNTSSSSNDVASTVLVQSDGKIVVSGYSINTSTSDFAVVRYNTDGTLDITFSFDGKLVTSFVSGNDGGYAATLQDDGKIVVAGYSYSGPYSFALCRLNSDGSLDNTFGSGGKVISSFTAYDDIYSVAIQDNGRIVVAGQTRTDASIYDNFAVGRYNSDGTLDNNFDTDGLVSTIFGTVDDVANAVAIQSDGKIVAAGHYNNGSDKDFAVARYISDSVTIASPCMVTVYDTVTTQVYDTTFVVAYDTITTYISVTDTLLINAVLTGITPPNNLNVLKIYPNPASDHISIDNGNFSSMGGYQLIIENAIAQQVFSSAINQQLFYLDISTWTGNGIYFVHIIDGLGNTIVTKKIVIQ